MTDTARILTLEAPLDAPRDEYARLMVREGDTVIEDQGTQVAFEAIYELIRNHDFKTILDVGCGRGEHAKIFRAMGKDVTTLDPYFPADIHADVMDADIDRQFDVVFCSHVLEHQRHIGAFLDRLISLCKPNGLLCITVPPEVHHGVLLCHPNQFNAGRLVYHLVLAGIDCRQARILTYGYNLSVIVPNVKNDLTVRDYAYEEEARAWFPACFSGHGKHLAGAVKSHNWHDVYGMTPHHAAGLTVSVKDALKSLARAVRGKFR